MTAPSGAQSILPAAAHARSSGTQPAQAGMSNRTVLWYVAIALAAILPGVLAATQLASSNADHAGGWLAAVHRNLIDIRFGSGLRFWLGVGGATAMALLLLYPLRKALARGRWPGRVGSWFHAHIALGLLGPVLILYHSNFGLGALNANVALWTMLVVVVSGLVGQFVYARVSADFYAARGQARRHREAAEHVLRSLGAMPSDRDKLMQALDALEAEPMRPRPGLWASLSARYSIETQRRQVLQQAAWMVRSGSRADHLTDAAAVALQRRLALHLGAYFRWARQAASGAVLEMMWARWRLFHLPLFLIMCVATTLHVAAVWNMDADVAAADGEIGAPVVGQPAAAVIQQVRRKSLVIAVAPATQAPTPPLAPPVAPPATLPSASPSRPAAVDRSGGLNSDKTERAPADIAALLARPDTATAPDPVPPAPKPRRAPVARKPAPAPATEIAVPAPPPAPVAPPPDVQKIYAELQKRSAAPQMGLGAAKPRTLAEQIADWQARFERRTFVHSVAETGFALTGKHLKVPCSDCHKVPLKEARSDNPRQCIACHKEDDVHRGRRPDCARCHTTNRWGEIKRRR